jgi:hypothetical protein
LTKFVTAVCAPAVSAVTVTVELPVVSRLRLTPLITELTVLEALLTATPLTVSAASSAALTWARLSTAVDSSPADRLLVTCMVLAAPVALALSTSL